jgi:hypothetical protein
MTTLSQKVRARIESLGSIDFEDGRVRKTPTRPYVAFFASIQTGSEQRYGDINKRIAWSYSAMVVNDTAEGCRLSADEVCTRLNDHERQAAYGDGMWSALDYAGPLIFDDTVEGDWAYSITLHFIARTEENS